jgi:very-short-patch-repair endonuclease
MDRLTFARHLRRHLTPAERRLWSVLRNRALGHKFLRQVPRGPYTLDFVCLERGLVIEVDGAQHADSESDKVRDAWLSRHGFRVLRFWNREVLKNLDGVRRAIEAALSEEPPTHPACGHLLPPPGEEGTLVVGDSD